MATISSVVDASSTTALNQQQSIGTTTSSQHIPNLLTLTSRRGRRWRSYPITIRNANVALVVLCSCALMQNIIVGGANNAILSTIERSFFMTSVESALFLNMYDIANILSSPFIGYILSPPFIRYIRNTKKILIDLAPIYRLKLCGIP